jgi:hypothetical protein
VAFQLLRIVGFQFFLYAVGLEYLLGPQHFLDLVEHRGAVLETPGHIGPDLDVAQPPMSDDLAAQSSPLGGVPLQGHQILPG